MLRQDSRTEIGADPISPELVNTKSLANDGGLEEILKEIEGIGSLTQAGQASLSEPPREK